MRILNVVVVDPGKDGEPDTKPPTFDGLAAFQLFIEKAAWGKFSQSSLYKSWLRGLRPFLGVSAVLQTILRIVFNGQAALFHQRDEQGRGLELPDENAAANFFAVGDT